MAAAAAVPFAEALVAHSQAWEAMWARSWILVGDGHAGTETYNVTQMYLLSRYMDLSQGSGPFPIKWQGG